MTVSGLWCASPGWVPTGAPSFRQRPLTECAFPLLLNLPEETLRGLDPIAFSADCVDEYLDSEQLESPVLLGSSFGGATAVTVALRRPERLRALILVSPVLARWQIPLAMDSFVDFLEAPAPLASLVAPLAAQVMGGFSLDREGRDELVRGRHATSRVRS